jgi:chromosome segregation ATPase
VLFSSVLFISLTVTTGNYKSLYEGEKTRSQVAEAGENNYKLAADSYRTLFNNQVSLRTAESAAHQAAMVDKDKQVSEAKLTVKQNSDLLNDLNIKVGSLNQNLIAAQKQNTIVSQTLDRERQDKDKLAAQFLEQTARLNSMMNDNDIQAREITALKEGKAQVEQDYKEMMRQAESSGGLPKTTAPQAAVKIDGSVTAVNGGVAQINLGSTSGVKKGMKFFVYRNDNFVAYLQIEEVDAGRAAGVITDAKRDVRQGDKVSTSLE